MAKRTKIIAGNWKMNKTATEAKAFVEAFLTEVGSFSGCEMVLCAPFTALETVHRRLANAPNVTVGAQNLHQEASGAFTGEVSAAMLKDLGCSHVIVGHSERRQYFGETDAIVNKKAVAALGAGLKPIVCVGETLEVRDAGGTEKLVRSQVAGSLAGLTKEQMAQVVVAYEPVWAIGTGRNATPAQAQEVHGWIRDELKQLFGAGVADATRIQYGGSVKASNAAELCGQPDIDGALVGGASLDPKGFADLVRAGAAA